MSKIDDKKGLATQQAEMLAARAVSALTKMPAEDRAIVLDGVPDDVSDVAKLVAAEASDGTPALDVRPEVLEARIRRAIEENDDRSQLDDTYLAGVGAKVTLLEATSNPNWREAVLDGAIPLRDVFVASGATQAEILHLVEELELLQDLHGTKDLRQVNDRSVRAAIEKLDAIDLTGLVRHAAEELATVLFGPLEQAAEDEDAIE